MHKIRTLVSHSIPSAFIFLLIGLFALTSVTLTLIGTRVYYRVTDAAAQNSDAQIALSYLCNKVRTYDAAGDVLIAQREGLPVLCLYETIDGEAYETVIYTWEGAIRERFAPVDRAFDPKDGEKLTDAESLVFTLLSPNLLQATVVMPGGDAHTLRMALRSGNAKEAT